MSDPTLVFSAREVGDFLDAIANPKRLAPPAWWAEFESSSEPVVDDAPAAPVIDVSPELAAVDTPAWLRPSPYPGGDWPPPPGFVS